MYDNDLIDESTIITLELMQLRRTLSCNVITTKLSGKKYVKNDL